MYQDSVELFYFGRDRASEIETSPKLKSYDVNF